MTTHLATAAQIYESTNAENLSLAQRVLASKHMHLTQVLPTQHGAP